MRDYDTPAGFKRLLLNSAMSLAGRGGSQVSNTVILLLIAHWRGAAEAGIYSLAVKYTALSLGFALLGLDSLLVRDVAQNPRQARNYVVNLSLLRLLIGLLAYGCLALFVSYLPGYAPRTARIVLLFTLSLIPESLYRLYQSTLVALDAYAPLARVGVVRAALGLPLGAGALWWGASLQVVVLLQLGINGLALLMVLVPLRTQLRRTDAACGADEVQRFSLHRMKSWLRSALSFAAIDGIVALEWQLDVVLLSFFTDERQVGLYGVAQALLSILMLLLYSVDTVVYPLVSRVAVQGLSSVVQVYRRLVTTIAVGVIPFAFLLSLSLALAVPRLLGREFVPILVPTYWLVAAWVIHFLNVPTARLIISLRRQKYVALLMTLSIVLNTSLNLLLIPSQGILAPAVARAVATTVYAVLCTAVFLRLLSGEHELWRVA